MAFQILDDLIRKVQVSFRKESGLSSYDPYDPSIPPLPSFDASISELETFMPDNPRCKKCKAKLLRGTQSLICIHCGNRNQNEDDLPDPISFNSTFGFQWLLHSIDLDQSETVELNEGQRTTKQEISLHDLLHFQLALSDESKKPKNSVRNKILEQSNSSLNLTGAYLGNIFSESPRNIIYSALEEPVIKQIESSQCKTFGGEEKLAYFSSFSNKHEGLRSPDSYIGSIGDLSSQVGSVYTPRNDEYSEKLAYESGPAISMPCDLIQNDLWNNVDSKGSQQDENFDGSVEAKDGPSSDSTCTQDRSANALKEREN